MGNTIPKQTGPRTLAGKQVSSKNAQKGGIFTKGYLAGEDVVQKQAQFDALCEQWGASDPSRLLLLRTIEQAGLGIERMMALEKLKIEGAMQSVDIAQEFAKHAGLDVITAKILPAWFFSGDDNKQKELAIWIDLVWAQAKALQGQFSDRLVPQIGQLFPQLYEFVMEKQAPNASFIMVLGQQYKQASVTLNLSQLMNEIKSNYPYHLIWARDPERYQIIIDGIRADQMAKVIDFDASNRYATSFQNRILKAFQGLAALNIHDQQLQIRAQEGQTTLLQLGGTDPHGEGAAE